jgi:4'-phosphopantetheinyl transferase
LDRVFAAGSHGTVDDFVKLDLTGSSPKSLSLESGEVHIWLIQLGEAHVCLKCCETLLSSDEVDRALRFKFDRDRRRFLVSHAAVRSILAAYLTASPRELEFSLGPNGKPELASVPERETRQFNLSHSHEAAVLALARRRAIGVDVEYVQEDFPFEEVAHRFFSPKEVAALATLPKRLQREAFYKCWTSKEAFLKAKGTGLSGKLDEVDIVLTDDERVQVKGIISGWTLREITLNKRYMAAVVSEGDDYQIARYQWEPGAMGSAHRHD